MAKPPSYLIVHGDVHMKKTGIGILLVLCILFAMTPVFCQAAGAPKLTVSTENARVGNEVTLNVSTANNPGIMAMILGIDYDNSALEFIGPEDAGFKGWKYAGNLVWLGSDDDSYDGTIVKLRFKVLDSAENGLSEVKVTFGDGDICNYDEEIIDFAVQGGGVNIKGGKDKPSDKQTPAPKETKPVSETPAPADEAEASATQKMPDKTDKVLKPEIEMTDETLKPVPDKSGTVAVSSSEPVNTENNADTAVNGMQEKAASEAAETENGDNNTVLIAITIAAVIVAAAAVIIIKRKKK